MAGTYEGGKAAAITNKRLHGEDHYARIGAIGGRLGRTGGFGAGEAGRALARRAGAIGGRLSRRGKSTSTPVTPRKRSRA